MHRNDAQDGVMRDTKWSEVNHLNFSDVNAIGAGNCYLLFCYKTHKISHRVIELRETVKYRLGAPIVTKCLYSKSTHFVFISHTELRHL